MKTPDEEGSWSCPVSFNNHRRQHGQPSTLGCIGSWLIVCCLLPPAFLCAQSPSPDDFNPGASVGSYAYVSSLAVQADGKILVGGSFTNLDGQTRNRIGRLNPDGTLDSGFNPGANSEVSSLAVRANGKILVGGYFTTLGGQPRNYIGRLNSDGTLDNTFNPGAGGNYPSVYSLAVQADGKILVGGYFITLGGQPRDRIGRLNADGTLDSGFNPGANSEVSSLAVQADGKILVGGSFTTLGGQPRNSIGRLNPDGTLDSTFNPGAGSSVYSLAVQADGKVLVGGRFTTLGGQPRNRIGRLNADGTLDSAFNPGASNIVYSIVVQSDGKILMGGDFTTLGGQTRNGIGRLNADGTLDSTFNPGAGSSVYSLVVQGDGKVLVGGSFTNLGGQPRNGIGRLNPTEAATQSLGYEGSTITWLRGGGGPEVWRTTFDYSADGLSWSRVGEGTRLAGLPAGQAGGWQLTDIALPAGGTLRTRGYATGGCGNASGWFVEDYWGRLALVSQPESRTNEAGTTATFWVVAGGSAPLSYQWLREGIPLADGGNLTGSTTSTLKLSKVFGGDGGGYRAVVSNADGSVTSQVAMLMVIDPVITRQPESQNRELGESATFSGGALGTEPLGYQWWKDGEVLAGARAATLTLTNLQAEDAGYYHVVVDNPYGSVTSAVALLTVNLATVDAAFNPGASSIVSSLAVQADGKILVGGSFTNLGGQTRSRIGRLNPDGTLDGDFNPGANSEVSSLAVRANGKILVGGYFTTLGGQPRNSIGRLNPDGTLDSAFNPEASSSVYSLAVQADGKILVGGNFSTLGGQPRDRIGRLNSDGTLDSVFNPGVGGDYPYVYSLAVQADGKILVGGSFTTLGGQPRNNIGRLNPDGTLDSAFSPGAGGDDPYVYSLAVQADGKILVGGRFTTLGGQPRNRIGRLNADGTLDNTFNPGAGSSVYSLVVQADGKILVGGWFTTLGGQTRNYIGRLNPDGTLDSDFDPGASNSVLALAVQADGKMLVGGNFSMLAGQPRNGIGRLNPTEAATQSLGYEGSTITWLRGGGGPEVWRTTFDYSADGLSWSRVGEGTRLAGLPAGQAGGWQLTDIALPAGGTLRTRGYATGGCGNASGWFVETTLGLTAPIRLSLVRDGSTVVLNWTGGGGSYQVQQTSDLGQPDLWQNVGVPVQTNSMSLSIGPGALFLRVREE